ncbi:hypothetical protein BH10BAC3_BH10BAC3_18280 [soil metagenome]
MFIATALLKRTVLLQRASVFNKAILKNSDSNAIAFYLQVAIKSAV